MKQFIDRDQWLAGQTGGHGPQDILSRELLRRALISYSDACEAEVTAQRRALPLSEVYARGYGVSQLSIAAILATAWGAQLINPVIQPPSADLVMGYGPARCLRQGLMPWRRIGDATIVLTAYPDRFAAAYDDLTARFGPVRMAVTTLDQLCRSVSGHCGATLIAAAETRVPASESCRHWNSRFAMLGGLVLLVAMALATMTAPRVVLAVVTFWTILILLLTTALRACAAYIGWRSVPEPAQTVTPARLPVITMLVPLYNETAITEHLLTRLRAVDYPRELLDVCLVLEADDHTTRATLGRTILPTWMRPVVVPQGTIKTKPRALNYALDFARGSIIGVWDAEDAPDPDQLYRVAHGFANSGPQTACLQGILDYYNADANWLTRCFSIEYAGWFRVILPGLRRMGLVVPLGGTTLFFRRAALEELGGWDAHNVTEDADLGVRLARHGYKTDLIATVTEEEANGRAWPWVKQRSRWLKGYAITYGVHMRNPARLWRDVGAWRFAGVQLLFLGTLSQFALAPLLWTFWLPALGFGHPLDAYLAPWAFWTLAGLFVLSELVSLAIAAIGVRKAGKSWLLKWAVTLQFYFPLAALAAYKGLLELATRPFFWDKTAHGVLLPKGWNAETTPPLRQPGHPVSDG